MVSTIGVVIIKEEVAKQQASDRVDPDTAAEWMQMTGPWTIRHLEASASARIIDFLNAVSNLVFSCTHLRILTCMP